MNSRSSVNESNLVNFPPDLSTLNALDKEPLLSFPFDHLYACHSESSDCGQSLTLGKNVELSTQCMEQTIQEKDAEIFALKTQNKRLKELLVYHLDLIQQQNDALSNREKSLSTVQVEIDTLKEKIEKQGGKTFSERHLNQSPLFQVPLESRIVPLKLRTVPSPHFSPSGPSVPSPDSFSNDFNSVLLETDSITDSYSKPFGHDPFDMGRPSEALPDLLSSDMTMPTLLDSPLTPLPLHNDYNMLNKLSTMKKEIKPESHREAKYTVTTNSGSPVIRKVQRNARRKATSLGSLHRVHKTPKQEPSTIYDNEIMTVNSTSKKAKMINTSGKLDPLRHPNTGSLSDRLQLIDTTPTGEDPYQIGEAEMREQSPIPRLVLPKNNRVRVHTAAGFELDSSKAVPGNITTPARRIYDPIDSEPKSKKSKKASRVKTNRRSTNSRGQFTASINSTMKTMKPEPDSTTTKREKDSWNRFTKKPRQTSLGDFSYGETANLATSTLAPSPDNLTVDLTSSTELLLSSDRTMATNILVTSHRPSTVKRLPSTNLMPSSDKEIMSPMDITKMNFTEIFQPEAGEDTSLSSYAMQTALLNDIMDPDDNFFESTTVTTAVTTVTMTATTPTVSTAMVTTLESETGDPRTKKRGARTVSGAGSATAGEDIVDAGRGIQTDGKRGRKRAHSSALSTKRDKPPPKTKSNRGGRGGYRGKRGSWVPVPTLTTRTPYHTALGNPDISWYLGHDPDIKKEDVEQLAESTSPNVEVPRWREMVFTSLDSAEGTENTDDEAYRKRHQKLEAEERRQLRWHMRRIREQRHVERLRLRQRDPWAAPTLSSPPAYTVWPSPLRDLHSIEITDVLPVLAFGDDIPLLPDVDFRLPWVRVSKAQKRSKRSKTLH